MKIEIKSWVTGKSLYEGEHETLKDAVCSAIANRTSLRNADLRNADLRDADLRNADLRGAALRNADLRNADLRNADLRGADLRNADLRNADLRGAALRNADLRNADLRGAALRNADLRGAALSECPVRIENIHQKIYEAATQTDKSLNMRDWHTCETTHCRAGWAVHLAGEGGKALEFAMGTSVAAAMIYLASDPQLEKLPDFYCDNDTALADMKRLAELEAARV